MAVRAQHSKVLEAIVAAIAVDVIEVEYQRATAPLRDPADRTLIRPAAGEEPLDDPAPAEHRTVHDEELVIGQRPLRDDARDTRVGRHRLAAGPSLAAHMGDVDVELRQRALQLVMRPPLRREAERSEYLRERGGRCNDLGESLATDALDRRPHSAAEVGRIEAGASNMRGDQAVIPTIRNESELSHDFGERARARHDRA